MSVYDRRYFDRWYRAPRTRVFTPAETERRVRFALDAAEFVLERPVRRVLDVCCGEGHWQPIVRRLRPRASWCGVDASAYAVARFGGRRDLRRGRFGELATLGLVPPFDLIVCAGALFYLDAAELRPGLRAIASLLGGVAFLEVFSDRDDITGDVSDVRRRPAAAWDRWMAAAGLVHLGLHCWVTRARAAELPEFARGRRARGPAGRR